MSLAELLTDEPNQQDDFERSQLERLNAFYYYVDAEAENFARIKSFPRSGRAFVIDPSAVVGAYIRSAALVYHPKQQVCHTTQEFWGGIEPANRAIKDGGEISPLEKTAEFVDNQVLTRTGKRWFVPVAFSLLKLHKYATLGVRYGFNYTAYLGDLETESSTSAKENLESPRNPIFTAEIRPENYRGYPSHLRAAFAHGNPDISKVGGFAAVAFLLSVTFDPENDTGRRVFEVINPDDYRYVLEQLARERSKASPRHVKFSYGTLMIQGSLIVSTPGEIMEEPFESLLSEFLVRHEVSVKANALLDDISVTHESLNGDAELAEPETGPLKRGMDYVSTICKNILALGERPDSLANKRCQRWKRVTDTLHALELADLMILTPNTSTIKSLPDAELKSNVIAARYSQTFITGTDLFLPDSLKSPNHLSPIWPRPTPVSVGPPPEPADAFPYTFRAQIEPLTGDELYDWRTWLPPMALNLDFQQNDPEKKIQIHAAPPSVWDPDGKVIRTRWADFADFENRSTIYSIMLAYFEWLALVPKVRLIGAVEWLAKQKKSTGKQNDSFNREEFKIKLEGIFDFLITQKYRLLCLWFLAHFLSRESLQDNLLVVLVELFEHPEVSTPFRKIASLVSSEAKDAQEIYTTRVYNSPFQDGKWAHLFPPESKFKLSSASQPEKYNTLFAAFRDEKRNFDADKRRDPPK